MTETKWKRGYCVSLLNGERECFQTIRGLAQWFRDCSEYVERQLQIASVVITEEDFDEDLWEELEK